MVIEKYGRDNMKESEKVLIFFQHLKIKIYFYLALKSVTVGGEDFICLNISKKKNQVSLVILTLLAQIFQLTDIRNTRNKLSLETKKQTPIQTCHFNKPRKPSPEWSNNRQITNHSSLHVSTD